MGMIHISTHWMKYLPFILVGAGFVLAVFYVFKRDHLLKFVIDSMTTDGKPDSKKMSGFVLVITLITGFFIAIYYAKEHQPQEFYVWCIAFLITSFYGIREVSRFVTGKFGGGMVDTNTTTVAPTATPPPPVAVSPAQPAPNTAQPKKDDDIG